jgi:hypothetical protein
MNRVTQIAVFEEFNVFLLIADKAHCLSSRCCMSYPGHGCPTKQ